MSMSGFPIVTDPSCPPGRMYVMYSPWSGTHAIYCHPDDLTYYMGNRWEAAALDATEDVVRAFWREPSNRRARDRAALENARTNARRREMRAR